MLNKMTIGPMHTIAFKRKLMSKVTVLQLYTRGYPSLKSVLNNIINQISPFESALSQTTCNQAISLLTRHLSEFLLKTYGREELLQGSSSTLDDFSCQLCCELLYEPVTIQCGHTFCNNCIRQKKIEKCLVCGFPIIQDDIEIYRTNISLSKVCKKWFSLESAGRALVTRGLQLFSHQQYQEAIEVFTKALNFVPNSHVLLLHRAEAHLLLGNLEEALVDAVKAISLSHKWSKTHFIKAEILFRQHSYEEALFSYLMALVLDPSNVAIIRRLRTVIYKLAAGSANSSSPCESDRKRRKPSSPVENVEKPFNEPDFSLHNTAFQSHKPSFDGPDLGESETMVSSPSFISLRNRKLQGTEMDLCVPFSFADVADQPKDTERRSPLLEDTNSALERIFFSYLTFSGEFSSSKKGSQSSPRCVESSLVDSSDFECILCMRLLHNPVCTPCGHSFCQSCIERCFDHSSLCPLCKQSVREYFSKSLGVVHPNCDYVTNSIIKRYLPVEYEERRKQHADEISELSERQPIFVCTIAFPGVSCPLHIFEPQYKLMLRRCLEYNDKAFGMCMPSGKESQRHVQIGTLLKVRNVQYFSDGRSVVDSVGLRRFKTVQSEVKDGYSVAKLKYIVDCKVQDPQATNDLCDKVYNESRMWFDGLDSTLKENILRHIETFPPMDNNFNSDNGPDWLWRVLAILPVEDHIKLTILGKNSLHERLLIMHRIFTCLQRRKAK